MKVHSMAHAWLDIGLEISRGVEDGCCGFVQDAWTVPDGIENLS